jgi:DNA-binding XRE family transcriptional regulator
MKTFRGKLEDKLKDPKFAAAFEKEKKQIEFALKIAEAREKAGLSQIQLARKAQVTQQQLSKIENGANCTLVTFIRVCDALKLNLHVTS